MQCDMCGKDTYLVAALIEGTQLNVCKNCTKYGKILPKPKRIIIQPKKHHQPQQKAQFYLAIVNDYARRIKQKRESLAMKQEDLAKQLNEKWSLIQKIESNHLRPSLKFARKLEKFLRIRLIEQRKEEPIKLKTSSDTLTIGDLIKVKTS